LKGKGSEAGLRFPAIPAHIFADVPKAGLFDALMIKEADIGSQAAFGQAIVHYNKGEAARAATLFARAAALTPLHGDARRLHGMALLKLGRFPEALVELSRAVALAPRQSISHLHHGVGLLLAGRNGRAAARFRRAAMLAPKDPTP
jgi:Flp pilus assembly protein TadD